ncbi:MAG: hypothetical protein Q7T83_10930 [Thermodesulfovibrionales bacterium]|nr:hypothetical protein [Thermodesulfovibrionales bacterium]
MPSYSDHIAQATHNEEFVSFLKGHLKYKDWLITGCFYSAIHYVEAVFFNMPNIKHTESSIPKYPDGRYKYTPHPWRKELIKQNLPRIFIYYRKLESNSHTARYLNMNRSGSASSFFTNEDALDMFDKNLQTIKTELKLP